MQPKSSISIRSSSSSSNWAAASASATSENSSEQSEQNKGRRNNNNNTNNNNNNKSKAELRRDEDEARTGLSCAALESEAPAVVQSMKRGELAALEATTATEQEEAKTRAEALKGAQFANSSIGTPSWSSSSSSSAAAAVAANGQSAEVRTKAQLDPVELERPQHKQRRRSRSRSGNDDNNNRAELFTPKQVGDSVDGTELAVVSQQQQQQLQLKSNLNLQRQQDKLPQDHDRNSELVVNDDSNSRSSVAIAKDRVGTSSSTTTIARSRFVGQQQQQQKEQRAPSDFSDQCWRQRAARHFESAAGETIEGAVSVAVVSVAPVEVCRPDLSQIRTGKQAEKGQHSSLDGSDHHVLALFSDSQKQQHQHHQHDEHQFRQQQHYSFEHNSSSSSSSSSSKAAEQVAAANSRQLNDSKRQRQRIKVTLSKPKQEPRRESGAGLDYCEDDAQDAEVEVEVESKLGEFYTINPSAIGQEQEQEQGEEEEREHEKELQQANFNKTQDARAAITEHILVQDEHFRGASKSTSQCKQDNCTSSTPTSAISNEVYRNNSTSTLISPIDSIELQLQARQQQHQHQQPQQFQLQAKRGEIAYKSERNERERERERVEQTKQKQNVGATLAQTAIVPPTTKLTRLEQENQLKRIASQRRRDAPDSVVVGGGFGFGGDLKGAPTVVGSKELQSNNSNSNNNSGSSTTARQVKPVRQWANEAIGKSILNTKQQQAVSNREEDSVNEINLLERDSLITNQAAAGAAVALAQQQQQQQQASANSLGPSSIQPNCPKQLAIYINGKIRSNSIFCSRSVSSNSFTSILKSFHSSGSEQQHQQQQQQQQQQQSVVTSSKLAKDSQIINSDSSKQIINLNKNNSEPQDGGGDKSEVKSQLDKSQLNSAGLNIKEGDDDVKLASGDCDDQESLTKSKRTHWPLVGRLIASSSERRANCFVEFLHNLNLNLSLIRGNKLSSSCSSGKFVKTSSDRRQQRAEASSSAGQFDLESQQEDDDARNRNKQGREDSQEQESKTYKLNPSSMFLRKAMRYYRLWIYSANLTILSGTIIFVLSTLYVTSDYRIKLIIAPSSPASSPSSSSLLLQQSSTSYLSQSSSSSSGSGAIAHNHHSHGHEGQTFTLTSDNNNNNNRGDQSFVGKQQRQQNHEFSISLNEPTMLLAYFIIALQLGLLQAIGCFGAIRTKERLIQAFWYIIMLLVLFDVVLLLYWLQRYNFMLKSLQGEMTTRLQNQYGTDRRRTMFALVNNNSSSSSNNNNSFSSGINYYDATAGAANLDSLKTNSISDSNSLGHVELNGDNTSGDQQARAEFDRIFTQIFDRIQSESQCCGMRNSADYKRAKWREAKLIELEARLKKERSSGRRHDNNNNNSKDDNLSVRNTDNANDNDNNNNKSNNNDDDDDDEDEEEDRRQLVKLLYQVPLVPASCCRRPAAGAASTATASGSSMSNDKKLPARMAIKNGEQTNGGGDDDHDQEKDNNVKKPVILNYPDDSQLPQKARVPAWSPSMVVDNLVIGPIAAASSSYSTSSRSSRRPFASSGGGGGGRKRNNSDRDAELASKSGPDDDVSFKRDRHTQWAGGGGGANEQSEPTSSLPTLADVIDWRWTGHRLAEGDEEGASHDNDDDHLRDDSGGGDHEQDYDQDQNEDENERRAESGANNKDNKISNRLKAKQWHYGGEYVASQQPAVIDDQLVTGVAAAATAPLQSMSDDSFLKGRRRRRHHRVQKERDKRSIGSIDQEYMGASVAPDSSWAVETKLDRRGRVLSRLIELIDATTNIGGDGGDNNNNATRLASFWRPPFDDKDDDDADDDDDDDDSDEDDDNLNDNSNNEENHSDNVASSSSRRLAQVNTRRRKSAIEERQLKEMRQILFELTTTGKEEEVDSKGDDNDIELAALKKRRFKWPNELHLSYDQFKLIEAFILNELVAGGSKDDGNDAVDDADHNGAELYQAKSDKMIEKNRPVGGTKEKKKKLLSRRSIVTDQNGKTKEQQQQQQADDARIVSKQRQRRARHLRLIRELISRDEELGGAHCLPRNHFDEERIYTRGCQQTIRAWFQASANILFVMGFCVLTVLKFCSLILLRLEIREMIHKIRVLKGMATEYNALQDLEPYLPRPSLCAQAAELTPAGVTPALGGGGNGGSFGAPGPNSCSSLAATGAAAPTAPATTGQAGEVSSGSPTNQSGTGGPPPRRLGGSFSEAVAAATAVAQQQKLAEAYQQHQQHHLFRHYGRAGSLVNCARAGAGALSALSACPSSGTMLTAPLTTSGCVGVGRSAGRINSTTLCPCVTSSLSVAHFGQSATPTAASSALQLHHRQQACSLRSDLFPAGASSMPRRHTAISVCPAAAAAAAAAAMGASCSQQYLMVRRGTYSPIANPLTSACGGGGAGVGLTSGTSGGGGGNQRLSSAAAAGRKAQMSSTSVAMDNLLQAQSLNYLSQHRHSAYAGTIQAPTSLMFGGGAGASSSGSRRASRMFGADETAHSVSQQEEEEEEEEEQEEAKERAGGGGGDGDNKQQQQQQRPAIQQKQLLSLEPNGHQALAMGNNPAAPPLPPPFMRQSSGGAQSAVNFSLDIAPTHLSESRRSIH